MPIIDGAASANQSRTFLALFAVAVTGGSVSYIPFLTILLPVQASRIAGDGALQLLAYIAFCGAIAASIANILFGWASDRTRLRRPWIAAGLVCSCSLLALMPAISDPRAMIVAIVMWQIALNMMLGPLMAWAGDCVPDHQKGLLGGLLAFAPALGALAGALVTMQTFVPPTWRPALVAILVFAMVAPLLILGTPRRFPALESDAMRYAPDQPLQRWRESAAARMWLSRLLVQIAEASLFAFLLLWFRSIDHGFREVYAANIFAAVLGASVVLTLFAGRWSDRAGRPIAPLFAGAGLAGGGLLIMAGSSGLPFAIFGYIVFGLASSVFLALHSSQTLRVLPSARHRGRDLGLFNLTNTVPSLIMPWLTLALVPRYGFGSLFWVLAALAFLACLVLPRQVNRSAAFND